MYTYDGRIELIYGPMFSGKSTELKRRITRHKFTNKTILFIKYIHNTRNTNLNDDNSLESKALITKNLYDIDQNLLDEADIIGIDEGQFFEDILEFSENLANKGKIVIISCLDSDFKRKDFNGVSELITVAESVTKLSSVCNICGNNASFTKRLDNSEQLMWLGGIDKYISCCRKCYFN